MAVRIPVYERRVGLAPLPGVRQQANTAGLRALGQVGEGIAQAATGVGSLVDKIRREQDVAAVEGAWVELSKAKQSLLDDPKNGYLTARKGKDAINERQSVLTFYEAQAKQIAEGLDNDEQRAAFSEKYAEERLRFTDTVDRHVSQQSDVLREETFNAVLGASRSEAMGYAARGESDRLEYPINLIRSAVVAEAEAAGWSPEVTEQRLKVETTTAYLNSMEAMVDAGNVAGARELLAGTRGELDEALLAKSNIEKVITAAGKMGDARLVADQAWAEAKGDPAVAAELLRAKGIADTAVFDEAMQRVQERGSEIAQARRQADAPRVARLEQLVLTHKGFTTAHPDYVKLSDEGKADALRLLDSQRRRDANDAQQLKIDRYFLALFGGLDLVGNPGRDKVSVDVERMARDVGASPTAMEQVRGGQKNAARSVAKDQGVSALEFQRQTEADVIEALGIQGRSTKSQRMNGRSIVKELNARFSVYMNDPKNQGIPPPQELVDQWKGIAFRKVRKAVDPESILPAALQRQPEMTQIEAEMKGIPFEVLPETPGGGRAPRVFQIRMKVTDGKQQAWLEPGQELPAGWSVVP